MQLESIQENVCKSYVGLYYFTQGTLALMDFLMLWDARTQAHGLGWMMVVMNCPYPPD